jgi:hypothetical protein
MTASDWIGSIGLVIQALLFGGLVWYCIETKRIRITSAAQLEALQTPCVTFHATPRDGADAVLEMDGARGAMILNFTAGDAVFVNMGNGPAVNIEYSLVPLDGSRAQPGGYVSAIPPGVRASVPISRGAIAGHRYQCAIQYDSLSHIRYETKLVVHNRVLTPPFQFRKA